MIKNRIVLLLLISASTVINSMHNKPFSQNQSLQKPLEFCKHALDEMNRRNISKADVTNVLSTTNLIKKQKHGRYCFTEQSDSSNPLQVILIMTQTKNIVVTAYGTHQDAQFPTIDQRFQGINNQKRKYEDR